MAELSKTSPQEKASGEQSKKQDTKEEIETRVKELREEIYGQLESTNAPPEVAERINQIFNDTVAAIPPDPQIPIYQRATIATTMTKLKEQLEAVLHSFNANKEISDKFMHPVEAAEKQAKEEDQKKQTAQPGGPSQSQEQTRAKNQAEQAEHEAKRGR